jgi:predicted RNA-binding protein with PUA domain
MSKACGCGKQIVWFFDKPTIVVCENCEVALYFDHKHCPHCGGKVTEFVKKED